MEIIFKEKLNIDLFDYLSSKNLVTYSFSSFNSSLSSVLYLAYERVESSIVNLSKQTKNLSKNQSDILDENAKSVLHSNLKSIFLELDAFYDNCLLIIRALTDPVLYSQHNLRTQEWLTKNKVSSFNQFTSKANNTHNLIRKISNIIKHNSYVMEGIHVENHNRVDVFGFNLSNITKEGHAEPFKEIHPFYKNKISTAISYNFIIKYTIFSLISYIKILEEIFIKNRNQIKITNSMTYKKILDILKEYPEQYFPDEYLTKPIIQCKFKENLINIKYPTRYKLSKTENVDQIWNVSKICIATQPRVAQIKSVIPYLPLLAPKKNNYWK